MIHRDLSILSEPEPQAWMDRTRRFELQLENGSWERPATPTRLPNPPAPKVLGRDLPDGTRKRLQVYLGGGHFSAKTSCF